MTRMRPTSKLRLDSASARSVLPLPRMVVCRPEEVICSSSGVRPSAAGQIGGHAVVVVDVARDEHERLHRAALLRMRVDQPPQVAPAPVADHVLQVLARRKTRAARSSRSRAWWSRAAAASRSTRSSEPCAQARAAVSGFIMKSINFFCSSSGVDGAMNATGPPRHSRAGSCASSRVGRRRWSATWGASSGRRDR